MRKTDLGSVDLNLLKLLDALLKERSVTYAGNRLGLSQPAASRALGRLRRLLQDPIVVRTRKGMEPTPRALALEAPLTRLLTEAQNIITPVLFDPATAQGRFAIASIDHMALMVLPSVISRLERLAPGLDLEIRSSRGDNVELVARGDAGLAIGVFSDDVLSAGFFRRNLYDEDLVCMVRRGHPALLEEWTAERFVALSHVLVAITGKGEALIDTALARQGLSRRVAVRLPYFLAAPMLVAESDMVLSLPRRLAQRMAQMLPLAVLELPLQTDSFVLSMIWHERTHSDPAHTWLRQQIVETLILKMPASANLGGCNG